MKFTLSWLKDHLDTSASLDEIKRTLDTIGLEVEGIEDPSAALGRFTIARVLEAKRHPNADKLQVLKVEIEPGKPAVEVVCGAPNARAGMIGVFAPLGTYIPGTGITLEKKPVRGVVSNGMMLSEREMQLSEDHTGIVDLDAKLGEKVGARYVDVLGLDDPIIEVKLTPNRPDCTGVRGIARDLAAAGLGTLKAEPKLPLVEGTHDCPVDIRLEFPAGAESACPCFAGRYIKGIENGSSPAWMQKRLKAAGQRPINAVVDVTNYVSIDRGRPLHVYDADLLEGAIRARLGKAGETFLGLNGTTYAVDDTMCVIADDARVLGFGGILGGQDTGCTEKTRNILIECAYFDPLRTAQTGRKANVQTDARYRFERGVDPAFIEPGLDLATHLMMQVAGGTPSRRRIAGKPPIKPFTVPFAFDRVERLMGIKLAEKDMRRTLETLGFKLAGKGPRYDVTVPSWRPDIQGPADLVEEIARIAGLETVPAAPLPRLSSGVTKATLTDIQKRVRRARRMLAGRGMVEAITWSFITSNEAKHFGGGADALELANPISSEMTVMRPSLLPGLLAAAARNQNRGFRDLALFEVGQAYRGDRDTDQLMCATGVRTGASTLVGAGRHWREAAGEASLFDVKADVVAVLAAAGFDVAKAQVTRDAPAWFHPGKSATLRLGPKTVLAHFGELHPATLALMDVTGPAAAFEVLLDALPKEKRKSRARPPMAAADLLPVTRDFAFVVAETVAAGDIVKAALAADKALIRDVAVFDLYTGTGLPPGHASVAIEVTIQPSDRTLTDAEIEAVGKKVVAEVQKATGGQIRS
ncbi:MAG: phenylalanine--tRNA ligase subunit beta [Hyphomicrobiales bacterium]|nr:phenylalanine--tRNA ligase subunit beta [Hyphomicrobiales bacterium]